MLLLWWLVGSLLMPDDFGDLVLAAVVLLGALQVTGLVDLTAFVPSTWDLVVPW